MSEITDFFEAGAADLQEMLGEDVRLKELPGGVERRVRCVLSTLPMSYPVSLGGAVVECSATALLMRSEVPMVRIGWRLILADGGEYEVCRVESAGYDPCWSVGLVKRR